MVRSSACSKASPATSQIYAIRFIVPAILITSDLFKSKCLSAIQAEPRSQEPSVESCDGGTLGACLR